MTLIPKFGYALWEDAESWDSAHGCETHEAAATYGFAENPEATELFTCEAKPLPLADGYKPDADWVLDAAEERIADDHYVEDNVYRHDQPAKDALEAKLKAAFAEWVIEYPPDPMRWEVDADREVRRHVRAATTA